MLAQGQFSSAERGGLAADVSSGLIFVKKKKNHPARVYAVRIEELMQALRDTNISVSYRRQACKRD